MHLNFPNCWQPCWWCSQEAGGGDDLCWEALVAHGVFFFFFPHPVPKEDKTTATAPAFWDQTEIKKGLLSIIQSCSFSVLGADSFMVLVFTGLLLFVYLFPCFTTACVWESDCVREKTKVRRIHDRLLTLHTFFHNLCVFHCGFDFFLPCCCCWCCYTSRFLSKNR